MLELNNQKNKVNINLKFKFKLMGKFFLHFSNSFYHFLVMNPFLVFPMLLFLVIKIFIKDFKNKLTAKVDDLFESDLSK